MGSIRVQDFGNGLGAERDMTENELKEYVDIRLDDLRLQLDERFTTQRVQADAISREGEFRYREISQKLDSLDLYKANIEGRLYTIRAITAAAAAILGALTSILVHILWR